MSGPGEHAEVLGTLAQEAGQLLDAIGERLAGLRASVSDDAPAPDAAATPPAEHGQDTPTCLGWCPICRGAELLRGDRPELAAKLLDTAVLIVGTLRSLIPPTAEQPEPEPAPAPGIERIDIR